MDDERLKRGTYLTEKYFDEQLECIREIRVSERKFYQKITDLYATAIAKLHAETEFEKYRVIQDRLFMSDFDRYMLELEESAKK